MNALQAWWKGCNIVCFVFFKKKSLNLGFVLLLVMGRWNKTHLPALPSFPEPGLLAVTDCGHAEMLSALQT